jgi:DNA invertase Pin-like site-specific DNA recombinase
MKAAIYARVSTFDQEPENQLAELRRYADAREWTATAYVDKGVSGAKDKRPALDALVADARRRKFDTLVVWRLDRLGRNLRHLILLLDELNAVGVAFVSLGEGDRHGHARSASAAPHPRGDSRVRTGAHPGTRPSRSGARAGAGA